MATINKIVRSYTDFDFAFGSHPITNNLNLKKNENAIKQSVINLLTIKRGEKPFHPEIASPVYDFLFENSSPAIKFVLQDQIRKYLETYEPRITNILSEVSFPDPNTLNVEVSATIVNTSEPITIKFLVDRIR